MTSDIALTLSGLITAAIGLWAFYFPWQSFVVDQTRQRLFELRDGWFDRTLEMNDPVDRAAAAKIRLEINHMIRFTHHVTVPVIVYASLLQLFIRGFKTVEDDIAVALDSFASKDAAREAKHLIETSVECIAWGMFRRSLFALATLPFLAVILVLISATFGTANVVRQYFERLVSTVASRENQRLVPH